MGKLEIVEDLDNFLREKNWKFEKYIKECREGNRSTGILYALTNPEGNLGIYFNYDITGIDYRERDNHADQIKFLDGKEKIFTDGYLRVHPPEFFGGKNHLCNHLRLILDEIVYPEYNLQKYVATGTTLAKDFINASEIISGIEEVRNAYFLLKKIEDKIPRLIESEIKKELGK